MRIGMRIIWAMALGLAVVAMHPGGPAPALAQAPTAAAPPADVIRPQKRRIPRITVVPLSRYHRECEFHLAVEHRPSGDVITPQQHCWWAVR